MVAHAHIEPGAAVEATDGRFGTVKSVIAEPKTGGLSYVRARHGEGLVTMPASPTAEVVSLVIEREELLAHRQEITTHETERRSNVHVLKIVCISAVSYGTPCALSSSAPKALSQCAASERPPGHAHTYQT